MKLSRAAAGTCDGATVRGGWFRRAGLMDGPGVGAVFINNQIMIVATLTLDCFFKIPWGPALIYNIFTGDPDSATALLALTDKSAKRPSNKLHENPPFINCGRVNIL